MLKLLNPIPFPPVIIALAYIFDLILGDPERLPHPVRWIGWLIGTLERALRRFTDTPFKEKLGGAILASSVVLLAYGVAAGLLYMARYSYPLFFALSAYIVWTSVAIKSLKSEALSVLEALENEGLAQARKRLSRIVGRDTQNLSKEGVLKAVIETVSENTSDGVVAPLFYLAIGGPPLMIAYKAINTLDSMVGYKNVKYLNFGWASARLDDAANYIPARLTSLLIVAASFVLGYNWMRSFRITLRDSRNHPSPNSGFPEASVAGALGLRLAGPTSYGGVLHEKPFIGDSLSEPGPGSVGSAIRIMYMASFLMIAMTTGARTALIFLL